MVHVFTASRDPRSNNQFSTTTGNRQILTEIYWLKFGRFLVLLGRFTFLVLAGFYRIGLFIQDRSRSWCERRLVRWINRVVIVSR